MITLKTQEFKYTKKLQHVEKQKYGFKRSLKHRKGNDVLLKKIM